MKIAIIGAGKLGLSIAKGLITTNSITRLYLTRRNENKIKSWEEYKDVIVSTDNRKAISESDILIFCSLPSQINEILTDIKDILEEERHIIMSAVAGFKISNIESIVGDNHHIIRVMPNTAISIGKSITCISSNKKGEKRIELTKAIFNKMGHSVSINEDLMQAATVICASGIAFWMRLIRASTQGAIQLGFEPDRALELSTHTCLGAVSLLIEGKKHPEEEIDRVTTPKGCTIEGLNEMEHQGLSASYIRGIQTSYDKILDLSEK